MMDQQNIAAVRPMSADPAVALAKALGQWPKRPQPKLSPRAKLKFEAPVAIKTSVEDLARDLGLRLGDQNELTIRRIKRGKTYSFVRANGSRVRDA
ncbi:DNA topoisomerase IB, partial [Escherichia coli]|nr:DNA topoisomerase IB [Escherichia coli]